MEKLSQNNNEIVFLNDLVSESQHKILFMVNYPWMQRKMGKEIEDHIGDKIPIQNDRKNCHYINAFISECLRHRSLEFEVSRKTLCDVGLSKPYF